MFVLLGHHRSGTSFVNSVVRAHPEVESINEPLSQHLDAFRDADMVVWETTDCGSDGLPAAIAPRSAAADFLFDLRRWLSAEGASRRGFKETCLFEKLGWLHGYLGVTPGALLVRDPRAVVASVIKRDLDRSWWAYSERLARWVGAGGQLSKPVDFDDRVAVCAAVWALRTVRGLDHARLRQWPVLRLEDLFVDRHRYLATLMGQLELPVHPQQIAFIEESWSETLGGTYSYRRAPESVLEEWKETLTDEDRRTIELYARAPMQELGYL